MQRVTNSQWDEFRSLMKDAHDSWGKNQVRWFKANVKRGRWGEDSTEDITYTEMELQALVDYNTFREWPINVITQPGELDRMTAVLILNTQYLEEQNYLTESGSFDFGSSTEDYFMIAGLKHKAWGDTPASQMLSDPVHTYIILQRDTTTQGESR